ncbi:MAG: hypothetical protein SFV54_06745 [Bryobacteraceae bacterium]|nr:hypothetical protein [Bryobacteraceae bacterium]
MFRLRFCCCALALAAVSAWALQDSLASLKLTRDSFDGAVTRYVQQLTNNVEGELYPPAVSRASVQALYAIPEASRASLAKELGLLAKSVVMSPAFAAAYEAYLKTSHNAVNHGLKAPADPTAAMQAAAKAGNFDAVQDATNKMMLDNFRQSVQQRLPQIATLNKQMLDIMIETDSSMLDMFASSGIAKAQTAKAKALLAEAKKQSATDLERARATYKSALLTGAGLENEAAASAGVEADKRLEQQRKYDRLQMKPLLKKKLLQFVAVAKTVDFTAATQMKDGRKVFTNPAHERRPALWKMLYRLGPAGSNAAAAVAQTWAAEL